MYASSPARTVESSGRPMESMLEALVDMEFALTKHEEQGPSLKDALFVGYTAGKSPALL